MAFFNDQVSPLFSVFHISLSWIRVNNLAWFRNKSLSKKLERAGRRLASEMRHRRPDVAAPAYHMGPGDIRDPSDPVPQLTARRWCPLSGRLIVLHWCPFILICCTLDVSLMVVKSCWMKRKQQFHRSILFCTNSFGKVEFSWKVKDRDMSHL